MTLPATGGGGGKQAGGIEQPEVTSLRKHRLPSEFFVQLQVLQFPQFMMTRY